MGFGLNRHAIGGGIFTVAAALLSPAAHADVVLQDNYWGGTDFYHYGDSIGGVPFTISSAVISRPDPTTLRVVINTDYAGQAGLDHTGYGALFITPGANAWKPDASTPHYATDIYKPGEWQYAFVLPQNPGTATGSAGLYDVANNLGHVIMSNVDGNTNSNPAPGSGNWIFRQDQAVQFNTDNLTPIGPEGSWSIGPGTITMNIVDNGLLGDDFALSWAMTCANDVIQGQVDGVPEPSTWAMMLIGFAGLGFAGFKRGRRSKAFAAA